MAYQTDVLYADVAQVQHCGPDMFGSGRLIGRNLVLTAKHVVDYSIMGLGERSWQVRFLGVRPALTSEQAWTWIEASVVWVGETLDLALLQLHPPEGAPDWEPRLRLRIARIDEAQHHRVRALGFPRGAKLDGKRRHLALSGNLDDSEDTLAFGIDSAYHPESPEEDWRGFSGSAVLLEESPDPEVVWIYGVVQDVLPQFNSQLRVAKLAEAWNDEAFCALVQASAKHLEPPSDPVASQPASDDLKPLQDWQNLTWAGLLERSLPQIVTERESARAKLRVSGAEEPDVSGLKSSLTDPWMAFTCNPSWKDCCLDKVGGLRALLDEYKRFTEFPNVDRLLSELLEKLRHKQPYNALRACFSAQLTRDLFISIDRLRNEALARQRDNDNSRRDVAERMDLVQRRAADLIKLGQKEVYRKCFLVMGGVGSGKTHFITDILARDADEDVAANWKRPWMPIWLSPPGRASDFADHFLRSVQSLTRVQWPTLGHFFEFISSRRKDARIVAILDDFHRWIDLDAHVLVDLASSIEDCTRFDQLFWLICVNDRAYADIAPATKGFWERYCDSAPNQFADVEGPSGERTKSKSLPRFGGWYRLDDIAEQQELGLRIIEKTITQHAEAQGGAEQGAARHREWALGKLRDTLPEVRQELSNPLVATVLAAFAIQHGLDLTAFADIRYIQYVEYLKQLLIQRSIDQWSPVTRPTQELVLQQAIDYVAWAFSSTRRIEQTTQELCTRIMEMGNDTELLRYNFLINALAALDRAHLIERFHREAENRRTTVEWTRLRLEVFWEYHLARQRYVILREYGAKAVGELLRWLRKSESKRLMTGVGQFLLVLLDSDDNEVSEKLWNLTLSGKGLPLETALFAGSRVSSARQKEIGAKLISRVARPGTPAELVAMISFVHLALTDTFTPDQRASILHPHFGQIGRAGLGPYCAFALSYIIAKVDTIEDLHEVLQWLEGAEQLGPADELAALCVKKILALVGEHNIPELVDTVLEYAGRRRRLSLRYEKEQRQRVIADHIRGRDQYLFRHWIFKHACFAIAHEKKDQTYRFLCKKGWYRDRRSGKGIGRDDGIVVEMEKFANFSIADTSHNDDGLWTKLLKLVHELAESDNRFDREDAFWLIRHSEPIPLPGLAIRVDEEFKPDLRTIARDTRLAHLLQREEVRAFLKLNLGAEFAINDSGVMGRGNATQKLNGSKWTRGGPTRQRKLLKRH